MITKLPALAALLLAVALSACDNAASSEPTGSEMANPPNLAGTWSWVELVTDASGVCADEINDLDTDQVSIAQSGSTLALTGLIGDPTATLQGLIYPPQGAELARIKLSGGFPEDGGSTTVQEGSWIKVIKADSLDGSEIWRWAGTAQSCTGVTKVAAKKN